jgi:hypothetical protein
MNASYPTPALCNDEAAYSGSSASHFKFRLVRILPAVAKDVPLQCTLEVVTLENSEVDYKALSYNWGEKQSCFKIQLEGQPCFVTSNLYLALQHIRDPTEPRLFFVDALCINQNDIEERGSQVQRMFDIYRRATQVVIFLGEQREFTAPAFDWISSAGKDLEADRHTIIRGVAARTSVPFSNNQVSIYQGIRDVLSRPWWRYVLPIPI